MKALIIFILAILVGCESLPVSIADHAATNSENCWSAAVKTARALKALEYRDVSICVGYYRKWERNYHAWVEYVVDDNIVVIDPYRLLDDVTRYDRDMLTSDMYRVDMRFSIESAPDEIPERKAL